MENIYQEPGYDSRYDYSHTILGSATVGDVTYSWKGTNAAAEVIISNLLTSGKPKGTDQLSLSTLGKNLLDPAVIIEGTTSISSFRTPFMQDSDFLKPHIFGAELGGVFANSYFSAFQIGNSGQSYYVGTVTSASWTVDQSVSPVPEPGTYGIFLLGVGFIGLALRKRGIANV